PNHDELEGRIAAAISDDLRAATVVLGKHERSAAIKAVKERVLADFADEDAYRAYAAHAEHQRVIADHIKPILTARTAVQYRVDG
ncbi:MAG: Dabb family protein, partial [Acidimicrobiales bacterium]